MRKKIAWFVVLLTGAASPAVLAQGDPAHLSLVAGYKAAFTCSAHFNAGRTVEQIAGDELNRIYLDYREALAALNTTGATIVYESTGKLDDIGRLHDADRTPRVEVTDADRTVLRIAVWRPLLGCVQLPTGARYEDFRDRLPLIDRLKESNPASPPFIVGKPTPGLERVAAAAFDQNTYGAGTETTAVLVLKDGVIIAERYREGFGPDVPQRTWSVAKSIAATVIGAAVHDGLIDVNEPAGLAAWSSPGDPRGAITIKDLMHMASGLTSPTAGNRTDDVYFGGGRVVDHAITNRLVAAPGTRWRYANNDTMTMMRALRERMRDDRKYLKYPFENVLFPLGMTHTFLEADWNGDFVMSSQVWTTARDLARLGQLYLNDGMWDGKRILPEGWAKYVATPAPTQPPLTRSDGSQIPGYGAQFWLFGARHGLPDGTYAALGNRGQSLMIVPERNMIIVRRGFDDNGGTQFDIARFAADVLAAAPD